MLRTHSQRILKISFSWLTLPPTNMAPVGRCLEDELPFEGANFPVMDFQTPILIRNFRIPLSWIQPTKHFCSSQVPRVSLRWSLSQNNDSSLTKGCLPAKFALQPLQVHSLSLAKATACPPNCNPCTASLQLQCPAGLCKPVCWCSCKQDLRVACSCSFLPCRVASLAGLPGQPCNYWQTCLAVELQGGCFARIAVSETSSGLASVAGLQLGRPAC